MKHAEKFAAAQKILQFLRALNRPPRKIRTESGYTTTHEILIRRARVELGIEFKLAEGGAAWRVYNEQGKAVGARIIGVCVVCGDPFLKVGKGKSGKKTCSSSCKRRRASQVETIRRSSPAVAARYREQRQSSGYKSRMKTYRAKWREKNIEQVRQKNRANQNDRCLDEHYRAAKNARARPRKRERYQEIIAEPNLASARRKRAAECAAARRSDPVYRAKQQARENERRRARYANDDAYARRERARATKARKNGR